MPLYVLILCTHNSARSILAEGMLNHLAMKCGKNVQAFSAGSMPSGTVNPFALEALSNAGLDPSPYRSKSWDLFTQDQSPPISLVITVCDNAASEVCPIFTRVGKPPIKVHWSYPDPSLTEGGETALRRAFELTRQAIAYKMLQLLALPLSDIDPDAFRSALDAIGRS